MRFSKWSRARALEGGGPGARRIGARMDLGDTLKVVVPGYKPKSYSMSAEDPEAGTFDITFNKPAGGSNSYVWFGYGPQKIF